MSQRVPQSEQRIVFMRSGGICAFPHCGRALIESRTPLDEAVAIAHIAHIVAEKRQGPRGTEPLTDAERRRYTNLLLLCTEHHTIVDAQPRTYSVAVLRQMKADHEHRIRTLTGPASTDPTTPILTQTVYSALLPVTHLPSVVFVASTLFRDDQEREAKALVVHPQERMLLLPLLLRGKELLSFYDLREKNHPFAKVVSGDGVTQIAATDMWRDAEGRRRYMTLLNRALYKYTGRLAIRYDPAHYRYYFVPTDAGAARKVTYRSLQGRRSSRGVVWQPKRRTTGLARPYWWHLAAALRFHQMDDSQWSFSIRPERHLTVDGEAPFPSDLIGRRVTSLKAKMYNNLYLGEVNFWRDYLSRGRPRIILNFGKQSAVISSEFLPFTMKWPGIPGDENPFLNELYEDDLFTLGDLQNAVGGDQLQTDDDGDETAAEDEYAD